MNQKDTTVETKHDAPDPAELAIQEAMLLQNENEIANAMFSYEQKLLTNKLSAFKLEEYFARVQKLSDILRWLRGVHNTRFVLPKQMEEANKKQAAKDNMRIVQP